MKIYLRLIFQSVIFLSFSCKENATGQKTKEIEKQVEIIKPHKPLKPSVEKKKKIEKTKRYEYKFVSTTSGLNYRDSPNGKIIGKFPLNTQLKIIDYPNVLDQIEDEGKIIKGEWVGVENEKDTVYVFDLFLSSNYTYSNIKIYRADPFYKSNDGKIKTSFLNLSESHFINNEIYDTFSESEQRKKLLERINVSELDSVYIYDIISEKISSYRVKDLPVITRENIYDDAYYEIGLDLGNNYTGDDYNFAYIGKKNPFQKGKLKPILWNSAETKDIEFLNTILSENFTNQLIKNHFYKYKANQIIYYTNGNRFIAVELSTYKIVFDKILHHEKIYLELLNYVGNEKDEKFYQFEGNLFKNKPPVFFENKFPSFGCSTIDFIAKNEPSIKILCDNRH